MLTNPRGNNNRACKLSQLYHEQVLQNSTKQTHKTCCCIKYRDSGIVSLINCLHGTFATSGSVDMELAINSFQNCYTKFNKS